MTTTNTILICVAAALAGFGVAGLRYATDGVPLSTPAVSERDLRNVPLHLIVHESLAGRSFRLDEERDRELRLFLHRHRQELKVCYLKVQAAAEQHPYLKDEKRGAQVALSLEVQFKDGRGFNTRQRIAPVKDMGGAAVNSLTQAWDRYARIMKQENFAFRGVAKVSDL